MTRELANKGTDTHSQSQIAKFVITQFIIKRPLHCVDTLQMHSRLSFLQALQVSGGRRDRHGGKTQN